MLLATLLHQPLSLPFCLLSHLVECWKHTNSGSLAICSNILYLLNKATSIYLKSKCYILTKKA
uniref:Uncharacterized protein n=1 Tax=Rhizophora mucronata TaxID=61149 RepID=A0A2P2P5T8_RHIMU